ncbi:hypothetical protein WICPIJ_010174 [Wickerhamomyces pijperi]|uniref:Uncharacterized protein n=1 Tax=Wickerhamomyces pijperi TaxID=599730 RepID=A0A9P8TBF0_WICPI|nr:hypothetical protein WICPIJ_010174 [Wickerhamomyces pijperi]
MTKDSSQPSLAVYRFNSQFFKTHEFSTIEPLIQTISTRINEAYKDIQTKYGYLDTRFPRVKDHRKLIGELHLVDHEVGYILLLVKDSEISDGEISERLRSKDIPLIEVSSTEDLEYNNLQLKDVLASVALRAIPSDPTQLEPKTFISFFRGAGRFLLEFLESLVASENPQVTHLRLHCLVCHDLVPLYSRFGYKECLPRETQVVRDGVVVEGSSVGTRAHKNYDVTWMNKKIRS